MFSILFCKKLQNGIKSCKKLPDATCSIFSLFNYLGLTDKNLSKDFAFLNAFFVELT